MSIAQDDDSDLLKPPESSGKSPVQEYCFHEITEIDRFLAVLSDLSTAKKLPRHCRAAMSYKKRFRCRDGC
jgi:hypothetical protein